MARPIITIFSTETCPFCKMAKSYLDSHGAKYANHFVDQDDATREQMVALTGQMGVPVTVLEYADGDKTCFIGFQEHLLEKALAGDKVGQPCLS